MRASLIFATGNNHKLEEARGIAGPHLDILSLRDAGVGDVVLEETGDTIMANAIQKALALYEMTKQDCFAEDTGLEVEALGGAPGVRTARYAGPEANASKNMAKLLKELSGNSDRCARFRTVIALVQQRALYCFEGIVDGKIAEAESGVGGFGYDPLFIPDGYEETFAQLPAEVKNSISHRSRALHQMMQFLHGARQI